MPVALATPSLHTLYGAPLDYRDALVIGISQLGASPDVASRRGPPPPPRGAVTVAITNEPDSALGWGPPSTSSPLQTGAGALGGGDEDLHGVTRRRRGAEPV